MPADALVTQVAWVVLLLCCGCLILKFVRFLFRPTPKDAS